MKNYTTTFYIRKYRRLAGLLLGIIAILQVAQAGVLNEKKLQAPALSNIGPAVTFTEEDDPVTVASGIQINNEGAGIQSATIKITEGYNLSEDRLIFENSDNIHGVFDQQKGELVLLTYPAGNNATIENFQNALRSVKYLNVNIDDPSGNARTISFTITDTDGNASSPLSKAINIQPLNDAPVLQYLERRVAEIEKTGRMILTDSLQIIDVDDKQITGAVVKFINGTFQPIADQLSLPQPIGNITGYWNSSQGELALSGTDTKDNYEKALRSVVYSVNGFFIDIKSVVKNISFTVNDGNKVSEDAIRYVAVNNPSDIPSWIADFTKSTNEDKEFSFNANDFKNNYAPDKSEFENIEIRTLPENGVLIFDGEVLTFNDLLDNGSGFRIEAANINKLVYKPDDNYSGPARFEWNSFDGTNFATSDAKVTISVTEVNDAPIIEAPSEVKDIPEDKPYTLPEIVVEDIDDQWISAEVKVDHGVLSVHPFLLDNKLLTFNTGDGKADKTLEFTGALGYVSYALSALTYQPDDNFSGTDQLAVKITDEIGNEEQATSTSNTKLTVIPVNDPPVLAGIPQEPLAYTENDDPVTIAPEATVSDEENNKIASATITIQEGFQSGEDKFSFTETGNISGSLDENILSFNGLASLADYQEVIRSITYENTSENPSTADRLISFLLKDEDDAESEPVTRTITIKSVDDPPVLDKLETKELNFVQFGGAVTLTNNIEISDPDDNIAEKATIKFINNSYVKDQDKLSFEDTDKITGDWNKTTGTLTLTGNATLEEYQNALRNVLYDNTSENPAEKERSVSFQVSSHGNNSNELSRKITIIVNERPAISSFSRESKEDQAITLQYDDFFTDGQYKDPDNFPVKDGFSRLSVRSLPQHGILLTGEDTLTQSDIASAGYEIDRDAIALVYIPDKDYNGADEFTWNAFDGAQYAAEDAAVNITLTPVNDAPVVEDFDKSTVEEENITFSLADFTTHYSDTEGDTLQKIMIRSVPTGGSLILNGISIPANTEIGAGNINNLIYVPDENFNGKDSFSWRASDGNTFSEQSASVAITITPINDEPLLRNFTRAIAESGALNFSPNDFTNNYIDVENDPIAYIVIESLTEHGTLLLNDQPVDAGTRINASRIAQLAYQPDASLNGGKDSFTWNASDGTTLAQESATVTIIVGIGVTSFNVHLNEDESFTFSPDNFTNNYGNPDHELQEVKIERLPVNGTLNLGASAVSEGQTISADDLGALVYTPDQNYAGRDSLSWNASDGSSYTDKATEVFFNIQPVNDAPEISTIENITLVAGESTGPISFTVSDVETEASSLAISASSDNESLISDEQIALEGNDSDRTITINTLEGQTGRAVINILVSDGDKQAQQSFTLEVVPYFITLDAGENIEVCNNQPFDITVREVSGGVPPYSYTWTCDREDCDIVEETGNTLTVNPGATTTYYVQATDANDIVSKQDTITISIVDCSAIDLDIPTGFTPNGDGINDTWTIENIAYLENINVTVFNRLGQQVFQSEGYNSPWNGTSDGRTLETGTYYYIINVESGSRVFKGSVTILR